MFIACERKAPDQVQAGRPRRPRRSEPVVPRPVHAAARRSRNRAPQLRRADRDRARARHRPRLPAGAPRQGLDGGRVLDLAFWMTWPAWSASRLVYVHRQRRATSPACASTAAARRARSAACCPTARACSRSGRGAWCSTAASRAPRWWRTGSRGARAGRSRVVGDLFAPALALGHAFGRLGCFAAGCCFGKASHGALGGRVPARQRRVRRAGRGGRGRARRRRHAAAAPDAALRGRGRAGDRHRADRAAAARRAPPGRPAASATWRLTPCCASSSRSAGATSRAASSSTLDTPRLAGAAAPAPRRAGAAVGRAARQLAGAGGAGGGHRGSPAAPPRPHSAANARALTSVSASSSSGFESATMPPPTDSDSRPSRIAAVRIAMAEIEIARRAQPARRARVGPARGPAPARR